MYTLWDISVRYWPDLVIAALLAVLVDVLRVRSRILEAWRWLKDKNAESSVVQINDRIAQQEKYRDMLQGYLASDKMLYLATLRSIVGILLLMCAAGAVLILGRLGFVEFPGSEIVGFAVLLLGIVAGIYTTQLGLFDPSKMSGLIKNVDTEISKLKEARQKLLNLKKPQKVVE